MWLLKHLRGVRLFHVGKPKTLRKLGDYYNFKHIYNKTFKRDSQRMVFFILSLGFVCKVVWLGSVLIEHHLSGRYVVDRELKYECFF